jgi:hypothetical protein
MALAGLLFVGAVLFINGMMLLGLIDPKAAGVLNLFVGSLQVITPTYLIFTANGDANTILAASGLYLFGFTYLYVGIGLLAGLDSTGVGYFSLFVAIMTLGYSAVNFSRAGEGVFDAAFGVIWLYWCFLWTLFFVLLGLKKDAIGQYTGYVTAIVGWVTAAIPAFLLLTGHWNNTNAIAIGLAIFGVVVFVGLVPLVRRRREAQHGVPSARTSPDVPATAG